MREGGREGGGGMGGRGGERSERCSTRQLRPFTTLTGSKSVCPRVSR